jgi:aspartyl-tRNA(Asn)/glutamyl-tRNA(Gln) amidotransferase subunit A
MTGDMPLDALVDRRAFLARAAVLAAATTAGTVALPAISAAGTIRTVDGLTSSGGYATPRPEALADITELTIAEAATLIRAQRLRPELLVEAYLDRIAAFDDQYQAFNLVLAGDALALARSLGSMPVRGPLHGIPLAIKDNYYTAGITTTANSFIFADFAPPFDATTVAMLQAAGAIVLGKTQMGPLATTRATTPDGIVTTVNA